MPYLLFGPEVRFLLQENDVEGMKAFLENLHPATVAEALSGDLEVEQVWKFLQHTNIRHQAAIFEYFPIDWQVQMVEGTGREHMAEIGKRDFESFTQRYFAGDRQKATD